MRCAFSSVRLSSLAYIVGWVSVRFREGEERWDGPEVSETREWGCGLS